MSIVGSAAILFYYDLVIGVVAALLFIPVAIINRSYMRRSLISGELSVRRPEVRAGDIAANLE